MLNIAKPQGDSEECSPLMAGLSRSQALLIKKYSNQREYFHLQLVQSILDTSQEHSSYAYKIAPREKITTVDHKFNDEYEYLTRYFPGCERIIEMAELCEYYKYYLEMPMIVDGGHFRIFYAYGERKKEIVYRKLKNILDMTCRNRTEEQKYRQKQKQKSDGLKNSLNSRHQTPTYIENILKGLSIYSTNCEEKDQSECFALLQQKLVNKYGFSKVKNLEEIDRLYNFRKLVSDKEPITLFKKPCNGNGKNARGAGKVFNRKELMKRMLLQSTNNSSLQQVHSNYNSSKNLGLTELQVRGQAKGSAHELRRKRDYELKGKIYEKELYHYRSSCEPLKRNFIDIYRREEKENKKKLRKRSCQNLVMKKFRTLDDENYLCVPLGEITYKVAQANCREVQEKPGGKNRQGRRSQVKSCQDKFEIQKAIATSKQKDKQKLNQMLVLRRVKYQTHPSNRHCTKDIKETIEQFKSKIRKEMKQIVKQDQTEKERERDANMQRLHTSQATFGWESNQKQIPLGTKRKLPLNSEMKKNKKQSSKCLNNCREGTRK